MSISPLLKLFALAGIAYAGYAMLVYLLQRQILYPGRTIQVSGKPRPV